MINIRGSILVIRHRAIKIVFPPFELFVEQAEVHRKPRERNQFYGMPMEILFLVHVPLAGIIGLL